MVVGEFTVETEVAVIGGGLAGCLTAIEAARRGAATTLVHDDERLGGQWMRFGGPVSETRQRIAGLARLADRSIDRPEDLLDGASREAAEALRARVEAAGVTIVTGSASFDGDRQLNVGNNPQVPRIRFRRGIIATGVRSPAPKDPSARALDTLSPGDALPERLLLLGGGAALLEVATYAAAIGCDVTWSPGRQKLLAPLDDELDALLREALAAQGIRLPAAAPDGEAFDAVLVDDPSDPPLEPSRAGELGLETDVAGCLVVDEHMRTTNLRLVAVGDAAAVQTSPAVLPLQARVAASTVAGGDDVYDVRAVPYVVRADPCVAFCGALPSLAAGQGLEVRTTITPDAARPQACAIVVEPETDVVAGVTAIGPGAETAVARGAAAIEMGAVLDDLEGMAG